MKCLDTAYVHESESRIYWEAGPCFMAGLTCALIWNENLNLYVFSASLDHHQVEHALSGWLPATIRPHGVTTNSVVG